ncbi:MAG: beta-ketoacyl-[acyl-carrier-protein] synthase family protein [bacterium]|nr:beta-ketoacyl-[acyl-carrier-protein] synthase family protein [bacterium]
MTKIVITGAGVNSPLGCSIKEFMHNLEAKEIGIAPIENFDTSHFPVNHGAEVKEKGVVVKTPSHIDRKAFFIKRAVKELLADSPGFYDYPPQKRMIHMGTGIDYFDLMGYVDGGDWKSKQWQDYSQHSNQVVEDLAAQYEIKGGTSVNVSACVASTQAVGLSYRILKQTGQQAIITGAFDSMLSHLHYMGFYKLGAFSNETGDVKRACKPFDKNRQGLVLGEGAVAFLLQRHDEVKQNTEANKGANMEPNMESNKILAEICGYGSTMDSYKVTDPHPEGKHLGRAAIKAIEEAGITPDDIDCAHLHGTGTVKNGIAEAKALQQVFPRRYKELPVFSLKAQIGHLIGACGAMELLAVIYSLQNQVVPPTLNFNTPDPEVPLYVIKDQPLPLNINYILKLNSGFGGQNTALVVKKYEQ